MISGQIPRAHWNLLLEEYFRWYLNIGRMSSSPANSSSSSESRERRKAIIKEIEEMRKSKVIVYFLGDRPNFGANIAGDAVRWIYDHILSIKEEGKIDHVDLYIYSRGGVIEAPWQIITTLRESAKSVHVLVPYKAYSATTLIALGADKILMGRKGELGPVDPQMIGQAPMGPPGSAPISTKFSVEDITSYVSFIKEKVGLTDQNALAQLAKTLAESLGPPFLGQVSRTQSHIRLVARKMLALVDPPIDNVRINQIVESLTEKIYVHGHSIGRTEAKQLGLQVEEMEPKLEKLCWNLFLEYENLMKLNSPTNPLGYFKGEAEEYSEDNAILACIESMNKYHEFGGPLSVKIKRVFPQPVNLNLNLPLQLPVGFNPQQLTPQAQQQLQQMLQQLQQAFIQQAQQIVSAALKSQSNIVGVDIHGEQLYWKEVKDMAPSTTQTNLLTKQ